MDTRVDTSVNAGLEERWETVRRHLRDTALACGRDPRDIGLLAVSKTFPSADIAALAALGQRDFGESYAQEAQAKIAALPALALCWHFIGPLQSNKTREVAAQFSWVHSVERLKIAERLSAQRPPTLPPLNVCVQVNISGEASKSGCAPDDTAALCAAIAALPRLRLRGLMAVPQAADDAEAVRPAFRALRALRDDIRARGAVTAADFDTLSMGMTHDYPIAIEEGATWLRIGSAIFGERASSAP